MVSDNFCYTYVLDFEGRMVDKICKIDNHDALVITEFHGIQGAYLGDPCYEQILSAHTGLCNTNSMGQSPP